MEEKKAVRQQKDTGRRVRRRTANVEQTLLSVPESRRRQECLRYMVPRNDK